MFGRSHHDACYKLVSQYYNASLDFWKWTCSFLLVTGSFFLCIIEYRILSMVKKLQCKIFFPPPYSVFQWFVPSPSLWWGFLNYTSPSSLIHFSPLLSVRVRILYGSQFDVPASCMSRRNLQLLLLSSLAFTNYFNLSDIFSVRSCSYYLLLCFFRLVRIDFY